MLKRPSLVDFKLPSYLVWSRSLEWVKGSLILGSEGSSEAEEARETLRAAFRSPPFRWRDSPSSSSSSSHREFSRWGGSADFRRPSSHGKQGGRYQFVEESSHGYTSSRSSARMFENDYYRPSAPRGDWRYTRNCRDDRVPLSQKDWRSNTWEMNNGSYRAFDRPCGVRNGRRSVEERPPPASDTHTTVVNSWEQPNSAQQMDIELCTLFGQLDLRTSRNFWIKGNHFLQILILTVLACLIGPLRLADDNSLDPPILNAEIEGTRNQILLKDMHDNKLHGVSDLDGVRENGKENSLGATGKLPMWTRSGSFSSQSSDATACAKTTVSEEMSSRKKQRLGWGEGLAKYENKKVDVNTTEDGTDLLENSAEELHSLNKNIADKSPTAANAPDYASPTTPSSVACNSSPDKSSAKAAIGASDVSNMCRSPSPVSSIHLERLPINIEELDNISMERVGCLLNELLGTDDPGDILKAVEMAESEIDLLESKQRALKLECGRQCRVVGPSSDLPEGDENVQQEASCVLGLKAVAFSVAQTLVRDTVHQAVSAKVPVRIIEDSCREVNALPQFLATVGSNEDILPIPSTKADSNQETVDLSSADDSMVSDEDLLCAKLLSTNKIYASESSQVFNKLLPRDFSSFDESRLPGRCQRQFDSHVKEKIAERIEVLRAREKILLLQFKAFQLAWKKDVRQLASAKYQSKANKNRSISLCKKWCASEAFPTCTPETLFFRETHLHVGANKKWKREMGAASLDILADGNYSEGYSHSFDFPRKRTLGADVVAVGPLSSEQINSCLRTSVNSREGCMDHLKFAPAAKKPRISHTTHNENSNEDDDSCSEESCGETGPIHWTDAERSAFIQGFSLFGKNFASLSRFVRTRSPDQCRVFFSKVRKCLGLECIQSGSRNVSASASVDNANEGGGSDLDGPCATESNSGICNNGVSSKIGLNTLTSPLNMNQEGANHSGFENVEAGLSRSEQENGLALLRLKDGTNLVNTANINGDSEPCRDLVDINTVESHCQAADQMNSNDVLSKDIDEGNLTSVAAEKIKSSDQLSMEIDEGNLTPIAVSSDPLYCGSIVLSNNIVEKGSGCEGAVVPKQSSKMQDGVMQAVNRTRNSGLEAEAAPSSFRYPECLHHVPIEEDLVGVSVPQGDSNCHIESELPNPLVVQTNNMGWQFSEVNLDFDRRSQVLGHVKPEQNGQLHATSTESCQIPWISFTQDPSRIIRSKSDLIVKAQRTGEAFSLKKCTSSATKPLTVFHKDGRSGHSRSHSFSLSDTKRLDKNGDVKLFGTVLTADENGSKQNTIQEEHLQNVPITSYGFWDGNRIQTGLTSLPESAKLVASYPEALTTHQKQQVVSTKEIQLDVSGILSFGKQIEDRAEVSSGKDKGKIGGEVADNNMERVLSLALCMFLKKDNL
ncbi:hypothetical protein Bca52824_077066 [Brassica carinata]|uniref:SANT domain-containing protein n=1 Tax=Brassica carinata TaxID=52824 RepID=A0A8X7PW24_BRACI|nr:hypothetical protein Bca52824_077066 [Brassica carinata]